MQFILKIRCDNEAFSGNRNAEVARILRELAEKMENGDTAPRVSDVNGNTVGVARYHH